MLFAQRARKNSARDAKDHFGGSAALIEVGKGAVRKFSDYRLSRYACYLIVQNSERKEA